MNAVVEVALPPSRQASVVLDIGGDVGALVLHVSADMLDQEIDLDPIDQARPHTHSAVRARHVGTQVLYAAVYPGLLAGSYTVEGSGQLVTIEGGRITEIVYDPVAS